MVGLVPYASSAMKLDASVLAVRDLEDGGVVATVDRSDFERLAAYASNVAVPAIVG